MFNIRRKSRLLLLSYLLSFVAFVSKKDETNIKIKEDYVIGDSSPFGSYSKGYVYITDNELNLKIDNEENNIIVIDNRNDKNDPKLTIKDSEIVKDVSDMSEIIDILLEYEERFPSAWDRNKESMIEEWIAHNICYELNFEKSRTREVDLDNDDNTLVKCIINYLKSNN